MVPGRVSESIVNDVVTEDCREEVQAAPLSVECPDGYSGWAGVVPGMESTGSAPAGVPSGPDCWIAVTGRQKTYLNFPSQHAIPASAIATFNIPNR
jgi:hypothetical protein